MFSLLGRCRKEIRAHLLSPNGGDNKNLMHAVPKLPGPQRMRDLLLFGVEPLSLEDGGKEDDVDNNKKEELGD